MKMDKKLSTKKIKTPEQIMKANLAKTLRGMKTQVADREELWLETFVEIVQTLISLDKDKYTNDMVAMLDRAELIANSMLDRYEARWGKG